MPSINLANVNISLNEFQRLSKGDHNAGEVKLAGEGKLAKINNHVHMTGRNVVAIPHEEVFAIKKAPWPRRLRPEAPPIPQYMIYID